MGEKRATLDVKRFAEALIALASHRLSTDECAVPGVNEIGEASETEATG